MSRFASLFILCLAAGASLHGQQPSEEPTYRVDSEVTVTGTVAKVFTYTGQRGTSRSRATLTLSDGSTVDIHIGPTGFLREKQMELAIGDRVTATGSRTGTGLVIVRQFTRGGRTLEMRNAAGRPLWEDRHK